MLIFRTYQGKKIRLLPEQNGEYWHVDIQIDGKTLPDPQPEGYAFNQLAINEGLEAAVTAIDEEALRQEMLHPW
jgi:hypothetical protein